MYLRLPVYILLFSATLIVLFVSGCGSDNKSGPGSENKTKAAAKAGPPATKAMQAFSDDGAVVEIAIEGNDLMKFNTEAFTVPASGMVRLTLKHTGNLPAQSMGHNVVILKQGIEAIEFGTSAAEQGGSFENHFVPPAMLDQVVAYTELVGGGESTTVMFQAPAEAGGYVFLCSFPGHAGLMNGAMTVK